MDRRTFLIGCSAAGVSTITGCITTQGSGTPSELGGAGSNVLGQVLKGVMGGATDSSGKHRDRMGYEVNAEAYRAYAPIFEQIQRMRDPSQVHLPAVGGSIEQATQALLQEIEKLPETLSDVQMAQLWPRLRTFVHSLTADSAARRQAFWDGYESMHRPLAGLMPVSLLAQAIPGTQQGAPRRRRYSDAAAHPSAQVIKDVARIRIRPGQTARIVMNGYCSDKTLFAFGYGQPLTLRPARDFIGRDRFGHIQMALLKFSAENPGLISKEDMQFMLWALQAKETNGSPYYLQALMQRHDLLQKLDAASPGALAELQQSVMIDDLTQRLAQMLRQNLPPEVRQLLGNPNIVGVLANPQAAPDFIAQELERMAPQNAPAHISRQPVRPEAAYSTLAPGVYAHAIGSARLQATVTLTNMSSVDYEFVPHEIVAETKTQNQRGVFDRINRAAIYDHPVYQSWDRAETIRSVATLTEALTRKGLGAIGFKPGDETYERFSRAMSQLHEGSLFGALRTPTAQTIISAIPILGNIKSAFDLFDPDASPYERVLAAFGMIPGYGNLVRIAGGAGKVAKVAQWALDNKVPRWLAKASDRTEFLRQINDLATLELPDGRELWQASYETLQRLVPPHLKA